MGTKEVLYQHPHNELGMRHGLYRSAEAMRPNCRRRLDAGPRVIKRNRGNGGQGVWKVETLASTGSRPMVRVLDATKDASEELGPGRILSIGVPNTSMTDSLSISHFRRD